MLVHQSQLMDKARQEGYALGSFDVLSVEYALGVLDAAEQAGSPVVLAITNGHFPNVDFDVLAPAVVAAARRATVPVVVHLDHATSLGLVARALKAGFNSVMYDGAGEPWEQHLAEIRVVVAMAHGVGATVEAALSEQSRDATANPTGGWQLPSRELAEEFVSATGVDVLAIGEGDSTFDVDRIAALTEFDGVFAALHGGSQLSDADLATLIKARVVKCSVFNRIAKGGLKAAKDYIDSPEANALGLGNAYRAGIAEGVSAQIKRFGSGNRG